MNLDEEARVAEWYQVNDTMADDQYAMSLRGSYLSLPVTQGDAIILWDEYLKKAELRGDEGAHSSRPGWINARYIQLSARRWFCNCDLEGIDDQLSRIHMRISVFQYLACIHQGHHKLASDISAAKIDTEWSFDNLAYLTPARPLFFVMPCAAITIISHLFTRRKEFVESIIPIAISAATHPKALFLQSVEFPALILSNIHLRAVLMIYFFGCNGLDHLLLVIVGSLLIETGLFDSYQPVINYRSETGCSSPLRMDGRRLDPESVSLKYINDCHPRIMPYINNINVLLGFIKKSLLRISFNPDDYWCEPLNCKYMATNFTLHTYNYSPFATVDAGYPAYVVFDVIRNRKIILDNISRAILSLGPIFRWLNKRTAVRLADEMKAEHEDYLYAMHTPVTLMDHVSRHRHADNVYEGPRSSLEEDMPSSEV